MNVETKRKFNKLYGIKKQRINYQKKDFVDYVIMTLFCGAAIIFTYGVAHVVTIIGIVLCTCMIVIFPLRHGLRFGVPLIIRRPQDILYLIIYKLQNIKIPYLIAIAILSVENYIIYLTPDLPHKIELMHEIAIYVFYMHFIGISTYRTVILIFHLYKKEHVREVLEQSVWKTHLKRQPYITLEILHAYITGVLTHIVYLLPWYLIITNVNFSIILLPITCFLAFLIQKSFLKVINRWFYRDHWLSHNSEIEFVYLHGTHHDAIPSGLIGVAGNGHLEGLFRGVMAFPTPFFNPIMAAIFYSVEVKSDIDLHQYIPGVFPKLTKEFYEVGQHSIHHFGRIEPYGFALNLDLPNISEGIKNRFKILPDELKYSIKLDEELTAYEWDNPRFRWFIDLVDKYQDSTTLQTRNKKIDTARDT